MKDTRHTTTRWATRGVAREDAMRGWGIRLALALAAMAMVAAATAVVAQTGGGFDLTWSSIDGGGSVSVTLPYEVYGVVGQPDAGVLTGGPFELEGGFLNFDTAQVPVELSGFAIE